MNCNINWFGTSITSTCTSPLSLSVIFATQLASLPLNTHRWSEAKYNIEFSVCKFCRISSNLRSLFGFRIINPVLNYFSAVNDHQELQQNLLRTRTAWLVLFLANNFGETFNKENIGVTFLGKWSFVSHRIPIDVVLLKAQREMPKTVNFDENRDFDENRGFWRKP